MKIAYFVNSFGAINWGGQATSNGIKYLVEKNYKNADFIPLDMPSLPFKKLKILRFFLVKNLYKSIMNDDIKSIYKHLLKFHIQKDFFKNFTHVCFNGEGAIHAKSGHLVLLMALLYIAKHEGLKVAAINQTVDLKKSKELEELVKKVYEKVDFLAVRESVSYEYVKNDMGLHGVNLIPDAAYGIPRLSSEDIKNRLENFNLPDNFIAIAGSSALKRDKKSQTKVSNLIEKIEKKFPSNPIVFLANAKTDIYIAHKLKSKHNYLIVEPPVKYLDAIAIISKAKILIGGRQHPNIFAYEYHVPYVPFGANTSKNIGVAKLQNYPISPLDWDSSYEEFSKKVNEVLTADIVFNNVKIDNFKIFGDI